MKWHTIPDTIPHRLDRASQASVSKSFEQIDGESLIERYLQRDASGAPNMVNTVFVLRGWVTSRAMLDKTPHPASFELTPRGREIVVPAGLSAEERAFTIGHQIGHILVVQHDVEVYKDLYPLNTVFNEADFATELVCDYISARMLGYVTD